MKLARAAFKLAGFAQWADEFALGAGGEFDAHRQLIFADLFPFDPDHAQRRWHRAAGEFQCADQWRDTHSFPADGDWTNAQDLLQNEVDRGGGGGPAAAASDAVPLFP